MVKSRLSDEGILVLGKKKKKPITSVILKIKSRPILVIVDQAHYRFLIFLIPFSRTNHRKRTFDGSATVLIIKGARLLG